MRKECFVVEKNEKVAEDTYKMILRGNVGENLRAGQFVNIAINGLYLRRPVSIAIWRSDSLVLYYKTVGKGTALMADMVCGDEMELLIPLGNGFSRELLGGNKPVLVGGGVGVPPMIGLAEEFLKDGISPVVVLGFNSKTQVFGEKEFEELASVYGRNIDLRVATMDGSYGIKGTVVDALNRAEKEAGYLFACGPWPMLKALGALPAKGQFSLEARMACGFGACMGCTCETQNGSKRICKDGPVLLKEEIKWQIP
ncbi:MAG: dihydroorotate dehydrogenase electron transfer subunit [Clostridiales bacterium]|nr:dihydroorotate dehydrogenase electron transfer subunit [Clostridiales bacterium]MDD7347641.1 dihydroorotate dehydrogenase electron transfer subunit [Clostridiales bacterium]